MTVYDFTQALARYKWVVVSSLIALIAVVGFMSFTYQNGKLAWRLGPKYESAVQIAIVDPAIERLATTNAPSFELQGAAALYAALLGTDEAAQFVGEANGYALDESIVARVSAKAPLIEVTVLGPSPEQAAAAAVSTFDFLENKLQTPLRTADFPAPPTTAMVLDGPFNSFLVLDVDATLRVLPEDLFLVVNSGPDIPTTIPLSSTAGQSVQSRATLSPVMTLALILRNGEDETLDLLRVAAPALTTTVVTELPRLVLELGPAAVRLQEDEWALDATGTNVRWEAGTVAIVTESVPGQDVQIALLTPEPGALAIGGRRGPIILFAALIVGVILLLAGVIVADTWRAERERQRDRAEEEDALPLAPVEIDVHELTASAEDDVGLVALSDDEPGDDRDPEAVQPWHWRKQA